MFGDKKIAKTFEVEGMKCMHCAKKVEEGLKKIDEVKKVKVMLEEKKVEITLKKEISDEKLKVAIEELGYNAKKSESSI